MSDMNAPTKKAMSEAERGDLEENRDLTAGRRVLQLEARALSSLANELDDNFTVAVDILAHTKGRICIFL